MDRQAGERRQQRHLHPQRLFIPEGKRRVSRITQGSGHRVVGNILEQGSMGFQAADTAVQLIPAIQGHKAGSVVLIRRTWGWDCWLATTGLDRQQDSAWESS